MSSTPIAAQRRDLTLASPCGVGGLVALPILTTADDSPIDLRDVCEGRPVVLLIVPSESCVVDHWGRKAVGVERRISALGARLFVIVPRTVTSPAGLDLVVDHGGRFAYTLGLADWHNRLGAAVLEKPAALLLDEMGRVIATDLSGTPDLDRLVDALAGREPPTQGAATAW